MRGITEFIKRHNESLKRDNFDDNFLSYHLKQINFLQHERLVHLIVMLFVIFAVFMYFIISNSKIRSLNGTLFIINMYVKRNSIKTYEKFWFLKDLIQPLIIESEI